VPRFVVYGAGAVGGVIGCRLFEQGHDVVLLARGAQLEAIARDGLRCESPDGTSVVRIPVAGGPEELSWRADDIVLLTVKGHDTLPALERLDAAAGPEVAVVCAQNGVDNERIALRHFAAVYAMVVQLPATHLVPGVVVAHSAPLTGALDLGCYPGGLDPRAHEIAATLEGAGFASQPRADILRWKYAKFLRNVLNAVDALFGHEHRAAEVARRARAEAVAALAAAGIDFVADAEYEERFRRLITMRPVPGHPREGGSSWQSLARGARGIEADQLNGEVVLLGRLHGVATPVNELLQRLAVAAARAGAKPGGHTEEAFLAMLADD